MGAVHSFSCPLLRSASFVASALSGDLLPLLMDSVIGMSSSSTVTVSSVVEIIWNSPTFLTVTSNAAVAVDELLE